MLALVCFGNAESIRLQSVVQYIIHDRLCQSIRNADNPFAVLNEHLSLLVESYVSSKVISSVCVTRIIRALMITAGLRSTSSRRLVYGLLVIALEVTGVSVSGAKGGVLKSMLKLGVSLVSETGTF